ncbi:potassium-transporting ATPase subunit KdpC [Methylovorus glucosotrophus]|uniref:Potassium-transporting ATPase KdpC subunit n=1 Tax=Methylovorus glucosotrophus (strain SIP3-4) TaxID=582744 RepID=C6XCN0_METGS|nr:potassium-transporting ATPase subunit KdpC [Methylovorus glucosotrophus]ACT50305.1 potassium-transporting ATPase, C subunit [Methylovorus glucosotrophus SIP3-4]
MKQHLRPALFLFIGLSLLTGLVYPLLVSAIGQTAFARQAAGSLLTRDGEIVGSRLIGQHFSSPGYFWSRPSATAPYPNNAAASSGSNLGPLNPALSEAVKQRVADLQTNPASPSAVPVDLVTSSASGLDPDISPAAAYFQVARIAQARHLTADQVNALVTAHIEGRQFGVLGEPRVNVLELNLALDALQPKQRSQ